MAIISVISKHDVTRLNCDDSCKLMITTSLCIDYEKVDRNNAMKKDFLSSMHPYYPSIHPSIDPTIHPSQFISIIRQCRSCSLFKNVSGQGAPPPSSPIPLRLGPCHAPTALATLTTPVVSFLPL